MTMTVTEINNSDSSKCSNNHNDDSDDDNMIMPVSVKFVSLRC
jgi:hypothetical protein